MRVDQLGHMFSDDPFKKQFTAKCPRFADNTLFLTHRTRTVADTTQTQCRIRRKNRLSEANDQLVLGVDVREMDHACSKGSTCARLVCRYQSGIYTCFRLPISLSTLARNSSADQAFLRGLQYQTYRRHIDDICIVSSSN